MNTTSLAFGKKQARANQLAAWVGHESAAKSAGPQLKQRKGRRDVGCLRETGRCKMAGLTGAPDPIADNQSRPR